MGGAELLGPQRDAVLLEHPARLAQSLGQRAPLGQRVDLVQPGVLEVGDAVHELSVASDRAAAFEQLLATLRQRSEVDREPAQLGRAGLGDEPAVDQARQLGTHVGERRQHRHVGAPRQLLLHAAPAGQDPHDVGEHAPHPRLEVPTDRRQEGDVRRLRPHRGARVDGLGDHGRAAVLQQLGDGRVGRAGQAELLGVVEPVEDPLHGVVAGGVETQQHQTTHTQPVPGVALLRGADDLETDARSLVHEAGVGRDLVAGAGLGDGGRQVAEDPGGLAGPGEPGVGRYLVHRLLELPAQRLLERFEVLAPGLLAPLLVDDSVGRAQVLGHLRPVPRLARHHDTGRRPAPALERVEQRLLACRHGPQELPRLVGGGHEGDAQVLRQRADQRGDQLLPQAGDVPGEVVGPDPVERGDRHLDGQAVVVGTGLEVVGQVEGQPLPLPRLREVGLGDLLGGVVGEHRQVEVEQPGAPLALSLPPLLEVNAGDDLGPDPGVVEVEEDVLGHHDVAASRAVLELGGLLEQASVVLVELLPPRVQDRPLALHQRVPDEQLASERPVDRAVVDEPVGDQRHAVQRDSLAGHHRGALGRPVRLGVLPLHQVAGQSLGPLGLDRRDLAGPQARGLHELAGHDERRGPPLQPRPREDREPRTAGAEVLPRAGPLALAPRPRRRLVLLLQHPDVGEQAREQRLVDAVGVRCVGGHPQPDLHLLAHLPQLGLEVLPLADAQVVEVLALAHAPERAGGQLALLLADVAPQVEPGQQVRPLGLEPRMQLVGLRTLLGGALARVLQRHRRDDDQDLAHAAETVGLEDHPPQARVDRQPRQAPPGVGEGVLAVAAGP